MHDPSSDIYAHGESMAAMPSPQGPGMGGYKFSSDELRVLAECNSESFFQRSLPIGTVFGLSTYAALQSGTLRPNARFGVLPKVTLAVVVGYFIGKISYQEACAQKLMKLPGSYIGQLLREQREGGPRSASLNPHSTNKSPTMFGAGPSDIYSDAGPGNSLDLDTDRPIFGGDDSYRPADQDRIGITPPGIAKPGVDLTYEELRKKNRGQYADLRQDPYKMDPNIVPPINRGPTPPPTPSSHANAPVPTNKYGDVID